MCAAVLLVGLAGIEGTAEANAAPERCNSAGSGQLALQNDASGPLALKDENLSLSFGEIDYATAPGLLDTGLSGCGYNLKGGTDDRRLRFSMAGIVASEYEEDEAAPRSHTQAERIDAEILHNDQASWQLTAAALQSYGAEGDRSDWNSALNSRFSLFNDRIRGSSDIAWLGGNDAAGSRNGTAQRHKLEARLFKLSGWSLSGNAALRYAESDAEGPFQKSLKPDRSGRSFGLALSRPSLQLTLESGKQRDNLDDTEDETNVWKSWQGKARLKLRGNRAGSPKRISGSLRHERQQLRSTTEPVRQETSGSLNATWPNGLSFGIGAGAATLYTDGAPTGRENQATLMGEQVIALSDWRLRNRAKLMHHWGRGAEPDEPTTVSLTLQASRQFGEGIDLALGADVGNHPLDDGRSRFGAGLRFETVVRF